MFWIPLTFGLRRVPLFIELRGSALLPLLVFQSRLAAPIFLGILGAPVLSFHIVKNGQIFTSGLAIIDAPQPNSVFSATGSISIAVDVSGNGILPLAASTPYSGLPNSFDLLEFYFISSQTGLNLTISTGPALLRQEPTSTVKHLNWRIPSCVPPGAYNLTSYETSRIRGVQRLTITPLPIQVRNSAQDGSCTATSNPLQPQPQPDNHDFQHPWLDPSPPAATITISNSPTFSSPAGGLETVTETIGPRGVMWPIMIVPPGLSTTILIQPSVSPSPRPLNVGILASHSAPPSHTGPTPTPIAVVFLSLRTLTTTVTTGATRAFTSVVPSAVLSTTGFVSIRQDSEQFLPANIASTRFKYGSLQWVYPTVILLLFFQLN